MTQRSRFIPACAGKRDKRLQGAEHSRFIPACAGNATARGPATPKSVHPRMRGERKSVEASPGQRRFIPACAGNTAHDADAALRRFIPACAGNTGGAPPRSAPSVHPRMRGEHRAGQARHEFGVRSSPHARGNCASPARSSYAHGRFIPACAGNAALRNGAQVGNGSSPHARGTQSAFCGMRYHRRFIPACAGNTSGQEK